MKKLVAVLKNYNPAQGAVIKGEINSPADAKIILRGAARLVAPHIYFKPAKGVPAKNIGCFLWGQPDKWKGVLDISFHPGSKEGLWDIEVWADWRSDLLPQEEWWPLLSAAIDELIRREFIESATIEPGFE